ncbi:hypothetical protein BD560DRAFT_60183 [Blakeslea trispora]|nr:hypothetical protein BD560DRAFT_60183 [Blakeslea trispora]
MLCLLTRVLTWATSIWILAPKTMLVTTMPMSSRKATADVKLISTIMIPLFSTLVPTTTTTKKISQLLLVQFRNKVSPFLCIFLSLSCKLPSIKQKKLSV